MDRNSEQAGAQLLAEQSGGRAFANTNGLSDIIDKVTSDSRYFYTLSYSPADSKMDGSFRAIEVNVAGGKYNLSYRRGYIALDAALPGSSMSTRNEKVQKLAGTSKAAFRTHTARQLLGIAAGILDGEMKRMAGDVQGSIEPFTRAVDLEKSLIYDEPEPLPFSPRHWLGAALLELKRFDEAERVYRDDLKEHPKNGWSLLGLKQALAGRGTDTASVDAELAAAWARADTWIRSSRF